MSGKRRPLRELQKGDKTLLYRIKQPGDIVLNHVANTWGQMLFSFDLGNSSLGRFFMCNGRTIFFRLSIRFGLLFCEM